MMCKVFVVLVAVFLIASFMPSTLLAAMTSIPMQKAYWDKFDTGRWEESADSLRLWGSGYRLANTAWSKQAFDLRNSETYYKWQPWGDGNYLGFSLMLRYGEKIPDPASNEGPAPLLIVWGPYVTSPYQFGDSYPVTNGVWYYSRIRLNPDKTANVYTATERYDDEGGTLVESHTESVSDAQWAGAASGYVSFGLGDNYGGTVLSIVVSEVMTTGAPVPEPSSLLALGSGILALAVMIRRRR